MHSQLEQFLFVGTDFPALLFHHLAVLGQFVGIVVLRHSVEELETLFLGQLDDFGRQRSGQTTALAEDHVPLVLLHVGEARFALDFGADVHQRDVLDILAERGHQTRRAHHRPHGSHFVEQLDQQFVFAERRLAFLLQSLVQIAVDTLQVGHHGAHHAAGQSATEQQRGGNLVLRLDEVAQEVVHELLSERTGLHVGVHINICNLEAVVAKHSLHRNDVGVNHTPGERFHSHVDDVCTVAAGLQHGSHGEARTRMSVILNH